MVTEKPQLMLVDVEVLEGQRHTHAGREYVEGELIKGMHVDSAEWLEGKKRVKRAGAPYPAKGGK